MTIEDEIRSWLPGARRRLEAFHVEPDYDHVGLVERIGDGIATVSGLPQCRLEELLCFEDGTLAIALLLEENAVGCVLLGPEEGIRAGSRVFGTGNIARVPVGEALLGRVVDPTGAVLDGGPELRPERLDPIERAAPGIVDRDLVVEPMLTGLTAVDSMIPLGRGQRELLIGDRKTGKTSIAVDTMINQRQTDMICVYAAIGQKASTVARVIEAVRTNGAFERCVFVVGAADSAAGAQWTTPYAACTIAEYFRDRGQHALLILDDLTKHAIVYRQLSLLLRKPPGREAYPGDIFYVHARLLERAARLSAALGGGSLTALPIAETQAGNMTAYIPTNLISITDGQIYLESRLFNEGQKPAVNVGMSVSRVGGKTQARAIKDLAENLKLDYAQFLELEMFTRFGSMVDDRTKRRIEHGRRIRAILRQEELQPLALSTQVALLLAAAEGKLAAMSLSTVHRFKDRLSASLRNTCPRSTARIDETQQLSQDDRQALLAGIDRLVADILAETGGPV